MYDAIFFDLDGTLIDTESVAVETGKAAFASLNFPGADDLLRRLIGVDQPTAAGMISASCPGIDLKRLQEEWSQRFESRIAESVPLKPNALEVVNVLSRMHRLALVTSSGREAAMDKLGRSGLLSAFETIIVREDVSAPKPAPEPYLLAASRFAADPSRCLVFEDSEPGAEAAHRAGMIVVQIPDVHAPSGRFAHHIAADLKSGASWAGLRV